MSTLLEHKFINSAYLSELWAAQDLEEKRNYFHQASLNIDKQIEDEYRHALMLKKGMTYLGYEPIEDVKFAMQNVIFKSVCNIDLKNSYSSPELFLITHEVMERRALWNYRTYRLGGTIDYYKDILNKIIEDEKGHVRNLVVTHPQGLLIQKADRWAHRQHLAKHYNKMNLLESSDFWNDYFSDSLIRPETTGLNELNL